MVIAASKDMETFLAENKRSCSVTDKGKNKLKSATGAHFDGENFKFQELGKRKRGKEMEEV